MMVHGFNEEFKKKITNFLKTTQLSFVYSLSVFESLKKLLSHVVEID